MNELEKLAHLQKEVNLKTQLHLEAVHRLPDEGEPEPHLLAEARRTQSEYQAAVQALNQYLESLLGPIPPPREEGI